MRKKYLKVIQEAGWAHSDIGDHQHIFEKHYDNLGVEAQFTIQDGDVYDTIMGLTFDDIVWSGKDGVNPVAVRSRINLDLIILEQLIFVAHDQGQMRLSEFIKILQKAADGSDPMVDFSTERWSEDLENCDYYSAFFEGCPVQDGKMVLMFTRDGEE